MPSRVLDWSCIPIIYYLLNKRYHATHPYMPLLGRLALGSISRVPHLCTYIDVVLCNVSKYVPV